MDKAILESLAQLLRSQRVASLGTLREGFPFVSLVLYAEAEDLSTVYLQLSRLAAHTQALRADPRTGLMVAQPDLGSRNPQTLGRVSILGEAVLIPPETPEFTAARARYLARFPAADFNFGMADFGLYALTIRTARYVADFGKIHDLTAEDFRSAAQSG